MTIFCLSRVTLSETTTKKIIECFLLGFCEEKCIVCTKYKIKIERSFDK